MDRFIEYVYLQTWTTGPSRKYWIVNWNGSPLRPAGGRQAQKHLESVLMRKHARGLIECNAAITETELTPRASTFGERQPWLERSGWEAAYGGTHGHMLASLAAVPPLPTGPASGP